MKPLILCLILSALSLQSQSISIFDIDTTNFPTMRAKFYAFDAASNQARPSASELTLSEDGIQRTITNVSCPVNPNPRAISSVLVIDVSGSMSSGSGGTPNIELAKIASRAWVNGIPLGKSNCAITSFDGLNYLNQDFTTNRTRLLEAIDKLQAQGGTDYDMALLNPSAGGLMLSKSARYKKVIIILTDGQPNQEPKTNQIIAEAKAQDCEIYAVTLSMPAPQSLKDITKATGGEYFENVTTIQDAELVYKKLLSITQKIDPCNIEWQSNIPCKEGLVNLELQLRNQKSNSNYQINQSVIASLEIKPNFFSFGKRLPSSTNDTTIIITARNTDFIITGINRKYGSSDFSIVNTSFPITIPKNTSTSIKIRFNPQDSSINYASFEVITDNCTGYFSANGGFPKVKAKVKSLKLTFPNGGETFNAGSDTIITWEGIAPSDSVSLDYSIDNGETWNNITKKATGLKYEWKNIPLPSSTKCIVRVKQGAKNTVDTLGQIIRTITTSNLEYVGGLSFSPDGLMLATAHSNSTIRLWDTYTGNLINEIANIQQGVMCLAFSSNSSLLASGNFNGIIKLWNPLTGQNINTLFGTGSIYSLAFSPDGSMLTSSGGYYIKLWNPINGNELTTLMGHFGDVHKVAFNNNGSLLATSGREDNTIQIWNPITGKIISSLHNCHTYFAECLNFSPDANVLATVGRLETIIKIWNIQLGVEIRTLSKHKGIVNGITLSPDGSLLASGSDDKTIKLWNPRTGKELKTLYGHNDRVLNVIISPDGSLLASVSDDNTIKLWAIDSPLLQSDTSDAVFSIVAPSPSSKDIDMKEELVGNVKDSLITDFVTNSGSYQFRVDSVYFTGLDANSFSLVSGFPKYAVFANSSKTAEVRFKPKRAGIHSAKVVIITPTDTLVQNITGVGLQPQLDFANNIINFGEVLVNQFKDTITATIKNIGNTSIRIKSIQSIGPNTSEFSVLGGDSPFDFQANTSHSMTLRFSPIDEGRESGRIAFEYDGVGSPLIVQLFGAGIDEKKAIAKATNNIINFGNVEIGTSKTLTDENTIKNIGNIVLNIKDIKHDATSSAYFKTEKSISISSLKPNEVSKMDLSFTPDKLGQFTGQLIFTHDGEGTFTNIELRGNGISSTTPSASISIGSYSAEAGGKISTNLALDYEYNLSKITSLSLDLEYNRTLLRPIGNYTPIVNGDKATINVNIPYKKQKAGETLTTIDFEVALGNSQGCELTLSNPKSNDNNAIIYAKSGTFTLLGICEDGGARLINPELQAGIMSISPNPTNDNFNVEVSLIEAAPSELILLNSLGQQVMTILSTTDTGKHTKSVNTDQLSTGIYYLQLRTATYIENKVIRVEK
jgi:WD40 repeat protein/uncharacterized protein YegL